MLTRHDRLCIVAASLASLGAMVQIPAALAQSKQMMIVNDDGAGPTISHFSMPDVMELREPDFTQRDLPIFQEKLLLSEAQTAAIERQIAIYLDAFEQLKKSMLSFPGAEPMIVGPIKMLGEKAAPGEGQPAAIVIGPGEGAELPAITLDELEGMEGGMGIDIGVRVAADDGGGEDGGDFAEAEPGVSVAIQSSSEIPEEVRKKLEEQAQAIAEKIKAQLEEQRANGGVQNAPPLPAMGDISKFEEQRAEMEEASKNFRKAKAQLRLEFVGEAQTTLTAAQLDRWPTLERALLREKSLPKGRLSGERTDLFKIIKPLSLNQSQLTAIAPHLDAYDLDLDSALRQRNSVVEEVGPKIDKAMSEQDFDRALSAIDRAISARVALRSLNERYIDAIAGLLPDDLASQFRTATLKNAYPQIYRATFADKTFAAAYNLEGIDKATEAHVREIEQAYRLERDEYDARIRRSIDKHQPQEPRRPIEHMKTIRAEGGPGPERMAMRMIEDNPIQEAFGKRRELDERYAKQVAGALPPDQAALLPKPPVVRKAGEPIIIRTRTGE